MADINFFSPTDVPQPHDRIKVERLEARPYPDGWRVRLLVDVTPFQDRPSLEIRVRLQEGRVISELSVIETMVRHMEFTVHIRGVQSPVGDYVVQAALYYGQDPLQVQHSLETRFSIQASE